MAQVGRLGKRWSRVAGVKGGDVRGVVGFVVVDITVRWGAGLWW